MRKVLIVITTAFVPYGGLTTVVMNYYRAMGLNGLLIDFASINVCPDILRSELQANGSRYYCLGNRKNIVSYFLNLRRIIQINKYDVVHINGNSSTMLLDLLPAVILGVPIKIAHVHSMRTKHPVLNAMANPFFKRSYNIALSVSKDAGEWLYGNNYFVLNNAINIDKYSFSNEKRKKIRAKYGFDKDTVIGTVGKLNAQKNHFFLLNVFDKLKKIHPKCKLMIVGGGELELNLKEYAKRLNIDKDVIFTGMVDDASKLIQAFDFFVFPSIFEGLGLALIEAQASGLRCLASDVIPKESCVTDSVKYMSLDDNYSEWAQYISTNLVYDRSVNSANAKVSITKHGYNINVEAGKLRTLYLRGKYGK